MAFSFGIMLMGFYTQGGDARGTIEDVFLDDSVEKLVGFG
jgi:hypothetical protein